MLEKASPAIPSSSLGSQAESQRCFPWKLPKEAAGLQASARVVSSPRSVLLPLEGLVKETLRPSSNMSSQRGLAKAGWMTPVTPPPPPLHIPEECLSHSSANPALQAHTPPFTLAVTDSQGWKHQLHNKGSESAEEERGDRQRGI